MLSKTNIETTSNNEKQLEKVMQHTYGFIKSCKYFSEPLNNIFGGKSMHWVDYELATSDNPEKILDKYEKIAYSHYCRFYNNDRAKGAARHIRSQFSLYNERRNEIFRIYGEYIKNI